MKPFSLPGAFSVLPIIPILLTMPASAHEEPQTPGMPPPPGNHHPGGFRPGYPDGFSPTHSNLAYATSSKSQTLDLFLPEGTGPFPLVINIHGGAFRMGSKEMLDAPIAKALLKEGIAVATINYRLSGEARFPAAVLDAKAAVRFLRANAAKWNLNPNAFAAFGQSAGGNLASLLGTSGGITEFDDPSLGNPTTSSRVQAVVDWFGPSDFSQMDAQAKSQGCPESAASHNQANSPESRYLGAPVPSVPDLVAKANPITYITPDDPPFLLQKGDQDCLVPVGQSVILHEALKAAKLKVEFDLLKGAGHGDMGSPVPKFLSETNVQRVVSFLKSALSEK
jgi:acetyl esterase/lipase